MELDTEALKRKVADHIGYADVCRDLKLAKKELNDALYAEDELKIHALKEIIENLNEVIKEEKKSLLVDQIKNYEINEFENYMNSTDNIKLNNNFK